MQVNTPQSKPVTSIERRSVRYESDIQDCQHMSAELTIKLPRCIITRWDELPFFRIWKWRLFLVHVLILQVFEDGLKVHTTFSSERVEHLYPLLAHESNNTNPMRSSLVDGEDYLVQLEYYVPKLNKWRPIVESKLIDSNLKASFNEKNTKQQICR